MLAVGGAITAAPEMHRYLVDETAWLSEAQFTSSIALAQAAPGPNILFVALMGFNVGMNAGAGLGGAGCSRWQDAISATAANNGKAGHGRKRKVFIDALSIPR